MPTRNDAPPPSRPREEPLEDLISRLLAGPDDPRREFVIGEASYSAVHALAAGIAAECGADSAPACLCAQDRAVVAAALLAALSGATTLILPHAFDEPVLEELRQGTGCRTVISDQPRPVPAGVRLCVPGTGGATRRPLADARARKSASDPWLRLFTGGSTGAPKMWTKTVRNLLAETAAIVGHYRVTGSDRILATVNSNHIYGLLYAILTPLAAEASVVAETPTFPAEIRAAGRRAGATILVSVPAHYRALNGHPCDLPALRLAFSSAGTLAEEDALAFSARTGAPVAEIYGSTETGGIAARVRRAGERDFKAFPAIAVRIEEERLSVRSDYLSPELPRDGGGFYLTSDRARATPDGRFELLGRVDGIIKVGGRRVDLEAVRQGLAGLPGVRDAVALAVRVEGGREHQIVAVVEADAGTPDLGPAALSSLPPHARPRAIKVLPAIPLTPAGKYDRKAIAALFQPGGPAMPDAHGSTAGEGQGRG
jgi:acyl-coenzyme A synthetase/AMP-(fatty) acid ligase